MKSVYLAGPMVFRRDPERVFDEMKNILRKFDLKGIAPLDNQLELGDLPPGLDAARAIYDADEELMDQVDAAIFNTDPFRRGTEMDAGTAFEIGYCRAKGLPMVGWQRETADYPDIVERYMRDIFREKLSPAPPNEKGGTSGEYRDPDGNLVHSTGCFQNLMIDMSIRKSGGRIYADEKWDAAFEQAAQHLSKLLQ